MVYLLSLYMKKIDQLPIPLPRPLPPQLMSLVSQELQLSRIGLLFLLGSFSGGFYERMSAIRLDVFLIGVDKGRRGQVY